MIRVQHILWKVEIQVPKLCRPNSRFRNSIINVVYLLFNSVHSLITFNPFQKRSNSNKSSPTELPILWFMWKTNLIATIIDPSVRYLATRSHSGSKSTTVNAVRVDELRVLCKIRFRYQRMKLFRFFITKSQHRQYLMAWWFFLLP